MSQQTIRKTRVFQASPVRRAAGHNHTNIFLSFYLDYRNTIDVSTDDGYSSNVSKKAKLYKSL